MPTLNVTFVRCVQGTQEINTDDEHLFATIDWHEVVGDHEKSGTVRLKQSVGDVFDPAALEVLDVPKGMKYDSFREAVVHYFGGLISETGGVIRVGGSGTMVNNTFETPATYDVDVAEDTVSW